MRAAEVIADEVAVAFGGEDPLHPDVRELLSDCRAQLTELKPEIEATLPNSKSGNRTT